MDDDAFFGEEDEEEDGELLMYVLAMLPNTTFNLLLHRGNFADALGDDFLGLRELGIAGELGLQSLTIPKRLLKSRNRNRDALGCVSSLPHI